LSGNFLKGGDITKRTAFLILTLIAAFAACAVQAVESIPRITAEELKAMLDRGEDVVILDVRSEGSYESSDLRIKGDIRMPLTELEKRYGELPKNSLIVAY